MEEQEELLMSHYQVLGADSNADYAEIRSKYRSAVLALHPDKSPLSCANSEGGACQSLSGDDHSLIRVPSLDLRPTIREPCADESSTVSFPEYWNLHSRFLRVQKAWEVLRDSGSRRKYDELLSAERRAREREEDAKVIGEEIHLQEMELTEAEDGHEAEYTYRCRCGDWFVVSREELKEAGFTGGLLEVAKEDEKIKEVQWQKHTIVLPCQSCSLHIRLHLAF